MNDFNVKEKCQKKLNALFSSNEYKSIESTERGYAIPEKVKKNAILFVGLNPSYIAGSQAGSHFYTAEHNTYKYFNKFIDISEKVKHPWTHLDLLPIRETNQKSVEALLKNDLGVKLIWENLQITKEILESISPKIIVVENSISRRLLGKEKENGKNEWLNYNFQFDNELGTYRVSSQSSNLYNTPVFFSSMLTGQRALDKGSYERLVWHINKAINK